MEIRDMKLTYVKRRVITYNYKGDKTVYHNMDVAPIMGNVYVGKFESDAYNHEYTDVYVFWPGVKVGLFFSKYATYTDITDIIDHVRSAGCDSQNRFIERIGRAIRKDNHVSLNELRMLEHIAPIMITPARKARESHIARLRANQQKKIKVREERERLFVAEKQKEFESAINGALDTIRNGGTLKNTIVTVYKGKYDYNSYSVINYLMRKYGVNCPLRTQGWINGKLVTAYIQDGKCDRVSFRYKRKNEKASQAFFRYMNELIEKVNQESEET